MAANETYDYWLKDNPGEHSVAMREYLFGGQTRRVWVVILTGREGPNDVDLLRAREYDGWDNPVEEYTVISQDVISGGPIVELDRQGSTPNRKHAIFDDGDLDYVRWLGEDLADCGSEWPYRRVLDPTSSTPSVYALNTRLMYAGQTLVVEYAYMDEDDKVRHALSTDDGQSWPDADLEITTPFGDWGSPSLVGYVDGETAYHSFVQSDGDDYYVELHRYPNANGAWGYVTRLSSTSTAEIQGQCLVAAYDTLVGFWSQLDGGHFVLMYAWSFDGGNTFCDPVQLEGLPGGQHLDYYSPNLALVQVDNGWHLLLTCTVSREGGDLVASRAAWRGNGGLNWTWKAWQVVHSPLATVHDFDANPSVAGSGRYNSDPLACYVWADERNTVTGKTEVWRRVAKWQPVAMVPVPGHVDNNGGRVRLDPDGELHYACRAGGNVHYGPVLGQGLMLPYAVRGGLPALAADGAGHEWVACVRDDTVWCKTGEGVYKQVFAGSNEARPGQPSIACYPNQVNGVYVGAVVFPVYDSVGGDASSILYGRVCTSGVVLDTVASREDLGDSCPCINIFLTDSAYVTYQHGSSVLCRVLEYSASDVSRPPAWGSAQTVTNSGFHATSVLEGSMLHCVWSKDDDGDHLVRKKCADLSTTGTWGSQTTVSEEDTMPRANPVYAGVGVSAWQEMANGKWRIRGRVRGDTVTFVANDTDAYHPHVVACSSATTPSVDQVRCHTLYTAGVVFEVDSAVYDTGQARYKCCSLNVSHAGAMATAENSGCKFLRKPGGDSLFCVYKDFEGSIVYSRSAAGDSWSREVVVQGQGSPAICQDSSGRRWLVTYKPADKRVEARYLNGSSWAGPQTVYTVPEGCELNGPIALAGAGGTSACAYSAFRMRVNDGGANYILVAKFDGSNVSRDTVASGTEQSSVNEPTIATEKGTGGDYVHVGWSGAAEV
ncbi:hypothetical protein FJY71_02020, partial [candidate division WOR-3 bacterium]|nr:hypothetical protein [candidate division WOR-3 bacterium]